MTHLGLSVRIWSVRAVSLRRMIAQIARQEPVRFVVVLGLSLGGAAVAAPRLLSRPHPWAPFAVALALAYLLEASRTDERLMMILGVNRSLVRVTDAFIWLSPLLAFLLVGAPRTAAAATLGIACGALLPAWRVAVPGRKSRHYAPQARLIALGATEWVSGLRDAPWLLAGSLVIGLIGSAYPPVTVLSLAIATLSATAYFWSESEGWMVIHAQGRSARSYLWHKIGVSCGLLGVVLAPILVAAVIRSPSLAAGLALAAIICVHAHVCGILCKYATHEEGDPMPAVGALIWVLVSAMVILPPAALAGLYLLERRAVARLDPFCRVT